MMTREEMLYALVRIRSYLIGMPSWVPGVVTATQNIGDLIVALEAEEPLVHGWLNWIEQDDGTGLHLRLYLHDDPDDRPDDTEFVIILPAKEKAAP